MGSNYERDLMKDRIIRINLPPEFKRDRGGCYITTNGLTMWSYYNQLTGNRLYNWTEIRKGRVKLYISTTQQWND